MINIVHAKIKLDLFIYLFIVLTFVSQLPALDEKKETLQNASVKPCFTQPQFKPHKVKSPPEPQRLRPHS